MPTSKLRSESCDVNIRSVTVYTMLNMFWGEIFLLVYWLCCTVKSCLHNLSIIKYFRHGNVVAFVLSSGPFFIMLYTHKHIHTHSLQYTFKIYTQLLAL